MPKLINQPKKHYSTFPNNIYPLMGYKESSVYCYILSKPDSWEFAIKRIARDLQMSSRTCGKSINILIELGVLKRIKFSNGKIVYEIDFPPRKDWMKTPTCKNATQAKTTQCKTDTVQKRPTKVSNEASLLNNKEKNKENNKENLSLFEECWCQYEKYGHKQKALDYWKLLNPEDHIAIKSKIPVYLNYLDETGYGKKMFQGWINPKERIWETTYENNASSGNSASKNAMTDTADVMSMFNDDTDVGG